MANHPVFFHALHPTATADRDGFQVRGWVVMAGRRWNPQVGQSNWIRWKRGLSASRGGMGERGGRGAGGAGGAVLGVEDELSHAFDDLSVHNSGRGPRTDEPVVVLTAGETKAAWGTKGELLGLADPWATSGRERRKLVEVWVGEVRATAAAAIEAEVDKYARKVRERSELQQVEDLQVLRRAQVVGMTTSGVAKMQRLISMFSPRMIIVEEAAEVLEAHILTSLTSQTQHVIPIGMRVVGVGVVCQEATEVWKAHTLASLIPHTEQGILIGDHVEVHDLSKDSNRGFDLEVSLFERLALSKRIPVYTLATQRHMRPEIADLICHSVYPDLRDHPFVQGYPDMRGMAVNLHFWDHDSPESGRDNLGGGKSKSNVGEAAMVVGLATYLLQQGYTGGEITILTPYVGQLLKLRQALSQVVDVRLGEGDAEEVEKAAEQAGTRGGGAGGGVAAGETGGPGVAAPNLKDAVRLATVDEYGEESTVIIISLVCHKPDGDIGFLKSPNRTNVLFSRAKHGMYIIGGASSMRAATSRSSLWPRIMGMLDSKGRVERFILLRCASHPDTVTHIHSAGEFKEKASEGGCSQMCNFRLSPCGHTCPRGSESSHEL
ncbi:unnamed protein product [Closterium sp. Naga37s-1]|nr:unnamed protein product [Closterium sp. Naga37s-1]